MREIIFRGKNLAGDWVEGDLDHTPNGGTTEFGIKPYADLTVLVDPATVGQFTGLLDKNGKNIFEGDLLKSEEWCCICEVIYKDGGFTLKEGDTSMNLSANLTDMEGYNLTDVEIVGNIHDRKEAEQ